MNFFCSYEHTFMLKLDQDCAFMGTYVLWIFKVERFFFFQLESAHKWERLNRGSLARVMYVRLPIYWKPFWLRIRISNWFVKNFVKFVIHCSAYHWNSCSFILFDKTKSKTNKYITLVHNFLAILKSEDKKNRWITISERLSRILTPHFTLLQNVVIPISLNLSGKLTQQEI